MGRTLKAVLDSMPKERQAKIEARYRQLKNEVESLATLRKAAGKAQVDVASALNISQPAVSKIEKQTDMYLSTLRNYIRAIGGDLELVVRLPESADLRLNGIGDLKLDANAATQGKTRSSKPRLSSASARPRVRRQA